MSFFFYFLLITTFFIIWIDIYPNRLYNLIQEVEKSRVWRIAILLKKGGDAHVVNQYIFIVYIHIIYLCYSISCSRSCLIRSTYSYNKKTWQNKKTHLCLVIEMYFILKILLWYATFLWYLFFYIYYTWTFTKSQLFL